MAKSGKRGKNVKVKIPKTIAGVKIPKDARRAGEALIEKAQSPEGRQVIASGLAMVATATAAVAARKARDGARDAAPPVTPAATDPAPDAAAGRPGTPGIDPQQLVDTIGQTAEALIGRLFGVRKPG